MPTPEMLAQMSVEQLMRRWPETIAVFRHRRMACIGCPVGAFTTVAEAARLYQVSVSALTDELCGVIDSAESHPPAP